MRNAIIRFCAIVALLGFGNEIRAVRSSGHLFLLNDSISPDENNGKAISGHLFSTKVPSKSTAIIFALSMISPFHVMQLSASAQ